MEDDLCGLWGRRGGSLGGRRKRDMDFQRWMANGMYNETRSRLGGPSICWVPMRNKVTLTFSFEQAAASHFVLV